MAFIETLERIYRRNPSLVETVRKMIWKYSSIIAERHGPDYKVKIMNFCGTHEWTTVHYGIRSLLPTQVELVAGPGCPVCITPSFYIDAAIDLALSGYTVYTFGDAFKLPSVRERPVRSLEDARARGGKVRVVYSFMEALEDASTRGDPSIFMGIGFETTAPGYAVPISEGLVPKNLKFMSILRLTPPAAEHAINAAIERGLEPVRGIIAPGHVSTIIGARAWDRLSRKFGIPAVVSGFEPLDLLYSIAMILKMIVDNEVGVRNEYTRLVTWEGNRGAQRMIEKVFYKGDSAWRGIGLIPKSGLYLRKEYSDLDVASEIDLNVENWAYDLPPGCRCADVTLGIARPDECPLFLRACKPERPYGPCMVSIEGACAVWARFGGGGLADEIAKSLGSGGG